MNARGAIAFLVIIAAMLGRTAVADPTPTRGMVVVVSDAATPEVKAAAQSVLSAAGKSPLLRIMSGEASAKMVSSEAFLNGGIERRAFNHLILVGLPDDPVIKQTWLEEARPITNGLYVFGWGNLTGDIGYLESDRNPFLHSVALKKTPFEAEVVTLTGSTPAGVKLAVDSFLRTGLVNGVVGGSDWKRGEATILDRDPLPRDFSVPDFFPVEENGWTRIGITPASEDEYRGVLADAGVEPIAIWRAKYYHAGVWDGAGADSAVAEYLAGLHRQSYGNTIWAARFSDASQAKDAAGKIAAAAHLRKDKDDEGWFGVQPPPGNDRTSGPLSLWQNNDWVFMSTLPREVRVHAGR
jgi:hypothetical protein